MTPEELAKSGTELGIQSAFFCELRNYYSQYPALKFAFHIPNGGERHVAVAARMKAAGTKKGVPDVFIPIPSGIYGGMFIEFKTKKGRLSQEQILYSGHLIDSRYYCIVSTDYKEAVSSVLEYLNFEGTKNDRELSKGEGLRE